MIEKILIAIVVLLAFLMGFGWFLLANDCDKKDGILVNTAIGPRCVPMEVFR
jgi:hypothetical protein